MSARIVCGIDDSPEAARAAAVASRLARDLDSRALLVQAADSVRHRPWALRRTRTRLKAIAEEYCFPAGTGIRRKAGDPAEALLAVAEEEDAELVVISSQGEGRISAALLGGVSSALMQTCPCPVVIVPPRAIPPLESKGMRTVVCGVAGTDGDIRVIRLAADLAVRLQGRLHAVHACDPRGLHTVTPAPPVSRFDTELQEAAERKLERALNDAAIEAEPHVLQLPAAHAVAQVADEQRAGLVVVGPPPRTTLTAVIGGSVAIQLAADGSTPVVVPPANAELGLGSGHYEVELAPA